MTFKEIIEQLSEPFPAEKISWRVGSTNAKKNGGKATKGYALAYIDARDVMERLDAVCGPENWQNKLIPTPDGMICELGIRLITEEGWNRDSGPYMKDEWIWKANSAGETKVEEVKGAGSDAFKRAAVLFGVGRYLYDLPKQWVDLDNGFLPKDFKPTLPVWALPKKEAKDKPVKKSEKPAPVKTEAKEVSGDDLKPVRLASKQAIDIFLKDVKKLPEGKKNNFKGWLKERKLTFGDGISSWNIEDRHMEEVARKISELLEPIEEA